MKNEAKNIEVSMTKAYYIHMWNFLKYHNSKKYFNEDLSQNVWGMIDKQVKYLHYYPKRKKEVWKWNSSNFSQPEKDQRI